MLLNFAIKDLYHFKEQTKAYIKSNSLIIAFCILFLNLANSMSLLRISSPVSVLSYTLLELITQYHMFLIVLILILVFVVSLNSNHAIIEHRKKDIAIMKAVGTYPQQLYSFYLTELLLLVIISFLMGWLMGFAIFLIFFLIMSGNIIGLTWIPDKFITPVILISLLLLTFLINGWEIRKIGRKSYNSGKTGKFQDNIHAKLTPFWKKILFRCSVSLKLSIKNLLRKKYELRQTVSLVSIAGMVMLTGLVGVFVLNESGVDFIHQAQGEYIIAIGAPEVVDSFAMGYMKFSNDSIPDLTYGNYTDMSYNITSQIDQISSFLSDFSINSLESRLYTVDRISESNGTIKQIVYNESTGESWYEFVSIGNGTRTRVVPIQGITFNSTLQNWNYESTLGESPYGTAIGDTLAGELYENAFLQWIIYSNSETNSTYRHKIDTVLIDPLNNGNSVYISLLDLQENLGRINYTNLILVDYAPVIEMGLYDEFFTQLSDLLGHQFKAIDLHPIFQQNEEFIGNSQILTLILSSVIAIVIIYIIYQFQKGRLEEDQKDMIILKALGGSSKNIRQTIFFEQVGLLFLGMTIALTGTLFIIILLLMKDAKFPSIWVPLGLYIATFLVFTFFSYISSHILVKKHYQKFHECSLL